VTPSIGGVLRQRAVTGQILVSLVLAILGAAAVSHVPVPRSLASTPVEARERDSDRQLGIRNDSGIQLSDAIVGSNAIVLEIAGDAGTPTLRSVLRGGRLPRALAIDHLNHGADASRARMLDLAYLEVATSLAYARAGTVAYHSTAPPPPSIR
jgi:hypothetical protein